MVTVVMVMIVIIMMVMLKISPLGDVMVSDGECCNGVGGVYDVENLTTE